MAIDITKGRYWGEGITLVDGCSPCSPGCDHCWSMAQAHRFKREGEPGHSSGILTYENGRFNGDIITYPERLKRFNTRKPKIFAIWNDLFHKAVPISFRDRTYAAMASYLDNTYLVLTKQPSIMEEYLNAEGTPALIEDRMPHFTHAELDKWPLPNIWHGLTVCNQPEWDEKKKWFLRVPGKKFLSLEPLLGPIDFGIDLLQMANLGIDEDVRPYPARDNINAVILGGETGPGARPMHPEWVRSVRDQCAAAGIPFFFKQWGEWRVATDQALLTLNKTWDADRNDCCWVDIDGTVKRGSSHGMSEKTFGMIRVGRNKAGRFLDGRTHDDLPWVSNERST